MLTNFRKILNLSPPKLRGLRILGIRQISMWGMLYMKSKGFIHSKIIGIGFNAINWQFAKFHELIKLQWDAYHMKSDGITTSKMIEVDFEGLFSRFELSIPPVKNRGPNSHEFIKMQWNILHKWNLTEIWISKMIVKGLRG